jgi:hypothetical protein
MCKVGVRIDRNQQQETVMLTSKSLARLVLAVVSLVAACAMSSASASGPAAAKPVPGIDTPPDERAVLSGTSDNFKAFHDALLKRLKVQSTEYAGVGCVGCDKDELDPNTGKPIRRYTFVGSPTLYSKFGAAWFDVQKKDMTLTFSDQTPTSPDCSPLPQPCVTNYACPQYGNCSKSKPGCSKCQ